MSGNTSYGGPNLFVYHKIGLDRGGQVYLRHPLKSNLLETPSIEKIKILMVREESGSDKTHNRAEFNLKYRCR